MASRVMDSVAEALPRAATNDVSDVEPVVAEVEGVRLRLHARRLRGALSLVEAARRAGLNRDELSRLEKGETTQVRFATIAKLLAAYGCSSVDDLVEVERVPEQRAVPLYAGVLAALADRALPASGPRRRAVRRSGGLDVIPAAEQGTFAPSSQEPPRRRRLPVGTVSR